MRNPLPISIAFAAGVCLPVVLGATFAGSSQGDDVQAILTATRKHFELLTAGDAAGHIAHHLAPNTQFASDGGLLFEFASNEEERRSLQRDVEMGLKIDLQPRHTDVRIYGNAAVVTGYVTGVVTPPGGAPQPVLDRRTAVLIKQGREWKEVHTHSSPVRGAPLP